MVEWAWSKHCEDLELLEHRVRHLQNLRLKFNKHTWLREHSMWAEPYIQVQCFRQICHIRGQSIKHRHRALGVTNICDLLSWLSDSFDVLQKCFDVIIIQVGKAVFPIFGIDFWIILHMLLAIFISSCVANPNIISSICSNKSWSIVIYGVDYKGVRGVSKPMLHIHNWFIDSVLLFSCVLVNSMNQIDVAVWSGDPMCFHLISIMKTYLFKRSPRIRRKLHHFTPALAWKRSQTVWESFEWICYVILLAGRDQQDIGQETR